jgi:hypothetical protein
LTYDIKTMLIYYLMPTTTDQFLDANLWGYIGTLTGIIALFMSWRTSNYSKPNIRLAKLTLVRRNAKEMDRWSTNTTTKDQMRNYIITHKIQIKLRNKKGGSGSIDKPMLVISTPNLGRIRIKPRTKEYERVQINSNTSSTETIDMGEEWHLNGGEIISDELEYIIHNDEEKLFEILKNYDRLEYAVEYYNNSGKLFTKKVTDFVDER